MKRWVVVLLVLLAVVILVSPGIVGQLAERNLKDSINWAESGSEDFLVTEEKFDRGWFTAEGRHRIELKHGDLRSALLNMTGGEQGDQVPALVVDTRIDHGLVPISSMARESGSLMPGLASTISTFKLDPGDGNLIPIPGTLYSQVRLTGATASRYLLEPGRFAEEDVTVEWQAADVSMTTDASMRSLQYEGEVDPVSLQTDEVSLKLGQTTVEGASSYTDFGLMVGRLALSVNSLSLQPEDEQALETGAISLDASNELVDDKVNASTTFTIADISVPEYGDVDLKFDTSAEGLQARSLAAIITRLQDAQAADDPDAALAALYPQVEADVQKLLLAGGELRINRFDVTLPQGEVATRLRLQLPESATDADFSWASIILALTASLDLRVPVSLMELAQATNPQAGALVAMGVLKREGDSYIVNAQYEKGLLTVNGAPMPIPLPGR